VIIIEEQGYSKIKQMKEKLKKKKKIEKEKGKKESLEKILVIFFVFGNEISLSNCYLKSLFEKKK